MMQEYDMRKISRTTLYLRRMLRFPVQRLMKLWLLVLRGWAGNWAENPPLDNSTLRILRHRILHSNKELQTSFCQVFSNYYYLCPQCEGNCCKSLGFRCFSTIDALIHGAQLGRITHMTRLNLKNLFIIFLETTGLTKLINKPEQKAFNSCPALGPTGCTLPLGERSDICVFPVCNTFLLTMTWQDYFRYVKVALNYLTHLTKAIFKLTSKIAESPG